ncbi:unnamed protein product [Blepharisma stoltei]|uniref:YCII-related domain-containing protein n=1 Tax=Blepharisma stoltei TaxID=1481888 RepID=A0AAU9JXU5_9CILI|nr:unnamed protein product [Blepharisma stoltei]
MLASQARRFKHFLLTYKYVEGMVDKRVPYRESHLAHARAYESRGLILGGALQNPIDTGVLLFEADERMIKEFAQNDPYVINRLVTDYTIREIMIVAGSLTKK